MSPVRPSSGTRFFSIRATPKWGGPLSPGRPPAEVARRLNDDLGGRTVCCDGWAHDYTWLGQLFETAGLVPRFRLESVNRLLDDDHLAQLDTLRVDGLSALGIARHRASSDARALQWALNRLAA